MSQRMIPAPASGAWFDLEARTEAPLESGARVPTGRGFLWLDLELPAPSAVAELTRARMLPEGLLVEQPDRGDVAMASASDHLRITLTGASMQGPLLVLDRRTVVLSE